MLKIRNFIPSKNRKSKLINQQNMPQIKIVNGIKIDPNKKMISKYNLSEKPLIEIVELRKVFGKSKKKQKIALNNISFNLYANQNIGLLGANGAGKTTAVEIIAGINKPTSGKIIYNYKYKKSFQDEIGIQFQDSSYPPGISVWDVIMFIIQVYNVQIKDQELDDLLHAFGLSLFLTKSAKSLSGGEQQRLNALLSILHKPKIVILDELSTGLDINIRNKIKKFIYEYAKKYKMTILMISHNVDEIAYLCDRIIILKNGEIIVDMLKNEIIKKYKSLEEFIQIYLN